VLPQRGDIDEFKCTGELVVSGTLRLFTFNFQELVQCVAIAPMHLDEFTMT